MNDTASNTATEILDQRLIYGPTPDYFWVHYRVPACSLKKSQAKEFLRFLMKQAEIETEKITKNDCCDPGKEQGIDDTKVEKDQFSFELTLIRSDGDRSIFSGFKKIGQILSTDVDDKLSNPDIVEITLRYFRHGTHLTSWDNMGNNYFFTLHLGYRRIFNFMIPRVTATTYYSLLEVICEKKSWRSTISDEFYRFFKGKRQPVKSWLHHPLANGIFLFAFCLPIIVAGVMKASETIKVEFGVLPLPTNMFVISVLFVAFSVIPSFVVAYVRWLFPYVRGTDFGPRIPRAHLTLITSIIGGLIAAGIWAGFGFPNWTGSG